MRLIPAWHGRGRQDQSSNGGSGSSSGGKSPSSSTYILFHLEVVVPCQLQATAEVLLQFYGGISQL